MSTRTRPAIQVPETGTPGAPSPGLAELTGAGGEVGRLLRVDPRDLDVDVNVRSDLDLTPQFVASVGAHLVQPIVAYRDVLGRLRVWAGHRRAVAAVEAGVDLVDVVIRDAPGDEAERIFDQLAENEHRAPLRAGDRAVAYEQLTLMGRSPESIAKRAHRPVAEVEQALTVAASRYASQVVGQLPDMPMDLAAGLAEVEAADPDGEGPARVQAVYERDGSGQARHVLQQVRDDLAARAMHAAAAAEWEAKGYAIAPADVYQVRSAAPLSGLSVKPSTKRRTSPPITPAEHADCPHRAVSLRRVHGWDAGKPREWQITAEEYCMAWAKSGHHKRYARNTAGATSGSMSEAQKAERRALIANSKAMDSANVVRREFEAQLWQRPVKDFPKDALQAAARVIAHTPGTHIATDGGWDAIAPDLKVRWGKERERCAALASVHKATVWFLASTVAEVESRMPRDWWRSPDESQVLLVERYRGRS